VTARKPCGDTSRVQLGVVSSVLRDAINSVDIGRRAQNRFKVSRALSGCGAEHMLIIGRGYAVELKRKFVLLQVEKRTSQFVNSVVRTRERTVPTGVSDHDLVIRIELL